MNSEKWKNHALRNYTSVTVFQQPWRLSVIEYFGLEGTCLVKAPAPTGSTLTSHQLAWGSVQLGLQKQLLNPSDPVLNATTK